MRDETFDVVVVGGGNAALSAAISAAEHNARVAIIERAPQEERGGNSSFTAGAMRFAYKDQAQLQALMPELAPKEWENYDFGAYTEETFFQDLASISQYRTDPALSEVLARDSYAAARWLQQHGVRFLPYRRQGAKVDGKIKWFGGLVVETVGGGIGLVDAEYRAAERAGVKIFYRTTARRLACRDGRPCAAVVARDGQEFEIATRAVVLACGGFEANAAWRARYLGPGWDLVKVRGCRYNQGDGLRMAIESGAQTCGNWSGAHAIAWDRNAPTYGDREIGELFSKHSYPFGIVVNADGKRFLDEGADYYLYTYAKYGQRLLQQPGQFAWQIFDAQVKHLMHDEYRIKRATRVTANSIEELVRKIEDVDQVQLLTTIREYNAAVGRDRALNPTIKDGLCTSEVVPPKSNWATPIEVPPFEAYAVTCGITFTYGGIKIDVNANVLDVGDDPIPGLYSAGEMVGGLFYFNYPGGSGLTNGAVFGRIAGRNAAAFAHARDSQETRAPAYL